MPSETASDRIPYGRQSVDDEDVRQVTEALRSDWLTQGPRVEAFEEALCRVTGARYAVAVSTGTAALHLAYSALRFGPGDEIVTSPNTFLATAGAAAFCGARPVFADVESRQFNLDPVEVERRITPRTRAIVAVDFAGHPADYGELREIATRHGVALISDACHSLGATWRDRKVGTLADATCLSFHPVKSITTGEGGAVLTDDAALADHCRRARSHGMIREKDEILDYDGPWSYQVDSLGWNYRITDLQCALGRSQLSRLDAFLDARARLARRYSEILGGRDDLRLPTETPEVRSAWHLYTVGVPAASRRMIFEGLRSEEIGVQVHYVPLYRQPFYRKLSGSTPGDFPRCEEYYRGAISLPLFPDLKPAEQDRVASTLLRYLDRHPATSGGPVS